MTPMIRAQRKVHDAVKNGTLMRPTICNRCGESSKPRILAHHEDYSQPLEVVWLCDKCHSARHLEITPEGHKAYSSYMISPRFLKDYVKALDKEYTASPAWLKRRLNANR